MAVYIIRDIPDDVWQKAKVKAVKEGIVLKSVFLAAIIAYAQSPVVPGVATPREYPTAHGDKIRASWTPERRAKHGRLIKKIAKRKRAGGQHDR